MAQQQNPQNQNQGQRNQGQQNQQNRNQFQDDDIKSQTGSKGMNAGRSSDNPVEGRDFDSEGDYDNEDVQFGSDRDDDDSSVGSGSEDALQASNRNAGKRTDRPIGQDANSSNDGIRSELGSSSQGTRAAGTKKGMNQQQQSSQGSQQRH